MYSSCSWVSLAASNVQSVYSSARYLYNAVSATAYIGSMSSSVAAALEARGRLYAKNSHLSEIVASLQQERAKNGSEKV